MPTDLGRPYDPYWEGRPPAMLETDIPVWWRWLEMNRAFVLRVFYDCLVGGKFYTEKQLKDPMLKLWRRNLAKRIDALVETANEVWICEVAFAGGIRSIGQLVTYQTLWMQDPKIIKPERLLLICAGTDEDIANAAATIGIQLHIIPAETIQPGTPTPVVP